MTAREDLFSHVLREMRYGKLQHECSEALAEAVQATRDTRKKASITLTITVHPDKADTGQYTLEDDIKLKLPKLPKGATIMFGTPEGNLQRNDPRQGTLQLRQVGDDAQPTLKKAES